MEKSINDPVLSFQKKYTKAEALAMSPLTLAWIGDGVFSDIIRKHLVAKGNRHVNHLTKLSVRYVCAHAQSVMAHALIPELTEDEAAILRRGRNTKSTPPKNADCGDYRYATGMEALCGYLSLTGETKRLYEIMEKGIAALESLS